MLLHILSRPCRGNVWQCLRAWHTPYAAHSRCGSQEVLSVLNHFHSFVCSSALHAMVPPPPLPSLQSLTHFEIVTR